MKINLVKDTVIFAATAMIFALCGTTSLAEGAAWNKAVGATVRGDTESCVLVRALSNPSDDVQVLEYSFPAAGLEEKENGAVCVTIDSLSGEKVLPSLSCRATLPPGRIFVSAKATAAGSAKILKTGISAAACGIEDTEAQPAEFITKTATGSVKGVRIVDFVIRPFEYNADGGVLCAVGCVKVEIETADETSAEVNGWRARVRSAADIEDVARLADNAKTVWEYSRELSANSKQADVKTTPKQSPVARVAAEEKDLFDGFPETALPCDASRKYDYLMISSEKICAKTEYRNFGEILKLREAQGLSSTIVLIEEITAKYSGTDDAEKLRNFIRDAYEKWNVKYVVLAGDADLVPARMITVTSVIYDIKTTSTFKIASDLYFQCLDGEYNSNGNGEWGEPNDGDGGGDVDLYPEVYIGRLPFESSREVGNWVAKTVKYEADRRKYNPDPAMGGVLFIPGTVSPFVGTTEMIDVMMKESFANVQNIYETQELNSDLFEINQNKYSIVESIDSYDTSLNVIQQYPTAAMPYLKNKIPAFIFDYGQYNGAFDRECIGEAMLGSNEYGFFGGMFLSVMSTELETGESVVLETLEFNRLFWYIFSHLYVAEAGKLSAYMHEQKAPDIAGLTVRWNYFSINLLGDPAQRIYGVSPEIFFDRDSYKTTDIGKMKVAYPGYAYGVDSVSVNIVVSNGISQTGAAEIVCPWIGSGSTSANGLYAADIDFADLGLNPEDGAVLYASIDLPVMNGEMSKARSRVRFDNTAPVILDCGVSYRDNSSLELFWVTDEPTTGKVEISKSVPVSQETSGAFASEEYGVRHTARIDGLDEYTKYYTVYSVFDEAGNVTTLPTDITSAVPGDYNVSITDGRETVEYYDWESSSDRWTVTNLHAVECWQWGQPTFTYGPSSGSRCWGTVLNGEYPKGAYASVVSPIFTSRSKPVISFSHWHEMQWSRDYTETGSPAPYGDYGIVEVEVGGIWTNVTYLLDGNEGSSVITGNSDGWKDARIILPEDFGNRTFRVRFTFVSDERTFEFGHYAGWYVDNLRVADAPAAYDVGFKGCIINDSATGDGDGWIEPGETAVVTPQIFNYGESSIPGLSGTAVILVGSGAGLVTMTGTTPAPVSYLPLASGETGSSGTSFTVSASNETPPGTVITVILNLKDPSGKHYDMKHDIIVGRYASISGTVQDAGTDAVLEGVTITAKSGAETLKTKTAADGTFALNGAVLGKTYTITYAKTGYKTEENLTTGGTAGIVQKLGRPVISVNPSGEYPVEVSTIGDDEINLEIRVENTGTADLNVDMSKIEFGPGGANWLVVKTPVFTLTEGNALTNEVTISSETLEAGMYTAEIDIISDDLTNPDITIQIVYTVTREDDPVDPMEEKLTAGIRFQESFTSAGNAVDIPQIGGSGTMALYINYNGSRISEFASVTITSGNPEFVIGEGSSIDVLVLMRNGRQTYAMPEIAYTITDGLNPGDDVSLELHVTAPAELEFTTNITFKVGKYSNISGDVRIAPAGNLDVAITRDALPADLEMPTNDVISLTFTDCDSGTEEVVEISSETCHYSVAVSGTNYLVRVSGRSNSSYPSSYPAPQYLTLADNDTVNLLIGRYNAQFGIDTDADVETVVINDAEENGGDDDGRLEAGETVGLALTVGRTGSAITLTNVTAELFLIENSDFAPACMTIVNGTDTTIEYYDGIGTLQLDQFKISVGADVPEGSKQLFGVRITDGSGLHIWYAEFTLEVMPFALHIRGKVTFDPSVDADMATVRNMLRISITLSDGLTEKTVTAGGDGKYEFSGLDVGGNYTVTISSDLGLGYDPLKYEFNGMNVNNNNVDFVVKPSQIIVAPDAPDGLVLEIDEGTWCETNVVIKNNYNVDVTARISVNYLRGRYDVLGASASVLDTIVSNPIDWSKVNSKTCQIGTFDIRFNDDVSKSARTEMLKEYGLTEVISLSTIPGCAATASDAAEMTIAEYKDMTEKIAADARVKYAQPSAKMYPAAMPTDPKFSDQWGLLNQRQTGGSYDCDINVVPVWEKTTGSKDVVVAVVDTGINWGHPDLIGNIDFSPFETYGYFDEDTPSDINGDEYPGVMGVDDDGDAESSRWHYNETTGAIDGPEEIPDGFNPQLWEDGDYDGIPDYFQPYISGKLGMDALYNNPIFKDMDLDGNPDILEDHWPVGAPNGIADYFDDEDGDGIHNETGIDFRDEDILRAGCVQLEYDFPWKNGKKYKIIIERWPRVQLPTPENDYPGTTMLVATNGMFSGDDDENGYIDDYFGWDFGLKTCFWDEMRDRDATTRGQHGTHLAGIIGASWNSIGVAGINSKVRLLPVTILGNGDLMYLEGDSDSEFYMIPAVLAHAYEYSIGRGAKVINTSWNPVYTGTGAAGLVYEVIKAAQETDKQVIFVVSAGNSNFPNTSYNIDSNKLYPAYYSSILDNVITVAATDANGTLASFSGWGPKCVQLAAPGVDIYSTTGGGFGTMSGTSVSSAFVSGAAALLWSIEPDADFRAIKNALLEGARRDPRLDGWVGCGHLDVDGAVKSLGRDWLQTDIVEISIPANGSVSVPISVNSQRNLGPGSYKAEIVATSDYGVTKADVNLTVKSAPVLSVSSITVVSDTDKDGYAEEGETVEFRINIENKGSDSFQDAFGILSAATGATVSSSESVEIGNIISGETTESYGTFTATISSVPAVLRLRLTSDYQEDAEVEFSLPSDGVPSRNSIEGRITSTEGVVSNAVIEIWGAGNTNFRGMRVLSDTNGQYSAKGLLPGSYKIRAICENNTRSDIFNANTSSGDVTLNITVAKPEVVLSTNEVSVAVQRRTSAQAELVVSNLSADAFTYETKVMPRRSVMLLSDGPTSLNSLKEPVERMGFRVGMYTNNYAFQFYESTLFESIKYSDNDSNFAGYDFVIADLTGVNGTGRAEFGYEYVALANYISRGGKVLFTGGNPFTSPDKVHIASLCGILPGRSSQASENVLEPVTNAITGDFVEVGIGDVLGTSGKAFDLPEGIAQGVDVLLSTETTVKLSARKFGNGGAVYYWQDNNGGDDWSKEGVYLDIVRNVLLEEFYSPAATQSEVEWLQVAEGSGAVSSGSDTITLSFNNSKLTEQGEYEAVIALVGRTSGEEIVAIPVKLTVEPPKLLTYTSGSVVDWRGLPIRGTGDSDSPIFQVIYAGPDGTNDPPDGLTGNPGNDDVLLSVYPTGTAYGRFGCGGVVSNTGRFAETFTYDIPIGTSNAVIYVRAWDSSSFDSSLVWGDSDVRHVLKYAAGESADFGSWSLTNIINELNDSNGDTIPDGWVVRNRPDIDPRAPVQALASEATAFNQTALHKYSAAPEPVRVGIVRQEDYITQNRTNWIDNISGTNCSRVIGLSTNDLTFIFALDQANSMIQIINTNDVARKVTFDASKLNCGKFSGPYGMDLSVFTNRMAVADTANNRVVVFDYDFNPGNTNSVTPPVPGYDFTCVSVIGDGTASHGTNSVDKPNYAAMDRGRNTRVYVADAGHENNRIAWFRSNGTYVSSFQKDDNDKERVIGPQGVALDPDGGVWVALAPSDSSQPDRVVKFSATGKSVLKTIGGSGSADGKFETPTDVKIWDSYGVNRLVVADTVNNRVQIFTMDGEHLISFGGSTGGNTSAYGNMKLPKGTFPLKDESVIAVADTGNGRIGWYNIVIDANKNGINDLWEDKYGLSSSSPTLSTDTDEDGLSDYAEYSLGTDPVNADTDGDGYSDGWEIANNMDPLDSEDPGVEIEPLGVTSLTASASEISAGGSVEIRVVYSKPVADDSSVTAVLSGAADSKIVLTTANGTEFTGTYFAGENENGSVTVAVSGAKDAGNGYYQNPPIKRTENLFTIKSSDAELRSLTATPGTVAVGGNVTVTAEFTKSLQPGDIMLELSGSFSTNAVMTRIGGTPSGATYVLTFAVPAGAAAGTENAVLSGAYDGVTGNPLSQFQTNALFTVVAAEVPSEPFPITMLGDAGTGTIRITWQTEAGGVYQVETNANLLNPAGWAIWSGDRTAAGTSDSAEISTGLSDSLFFRVKKIK